MEDNRPRTKKMRRSLSILLVILLVSFFFSLLIFETRLINKDTEVKDIQLKLSSSLAQEEIIAPRMNYETPNTDTITKKVKSFSEKHNSDSDSNTEPDSNTDSNANTQETTGIQSTESFSAEMQANLPESSALASSGNSEHIYVILYLANIDGTADPIWYPFYERAVEYHDSLDIPVVFSFFPMTLHNQSGFGDIFKKMYLSDNIELAQKGITMNESEKNLYLLSVEEQKGMIRSGRDYYENYMKGLLGDEQAEVHLPVTFVAPFSSLSNNTRDALEELGFKDSLGLYYRPEIGPIQSTENFNCIQYGLSFTTTGSAGRDLNFKTPDQVISELKNYERLDLPILKINGDKVIPLFVHQPDFEDAFINGKINETKWSIYTETLSRLMNDPDVTFISAEQAWELTHPINNGEPICQYAKTASALSENSGSEAIFATGAPDSSSQNECNNWGGSGYSWNPINWNTVANLTLTYDKLVYANNLTIFGDYDMCFRNIWVKNSKTGEIKNIFSGNDNNCNIQKDVDNFLTDTIILETCGWAWSSTDSVQLCGIYNSPEEPPEPPSTKICQYATASSALSENSGSEAIFATGPPNSPSSGVCDSWAGTGYSWNPTNWNIKSNITLTYEDMMNVDNFTVIGDYDMCWDRIWLKNSQTGETLSVFTGPSSECVLTRGVSSNLEADTIILETCGWAWSSTDSVQLCGNVFIS